MRFDGERADQAQAALGVWQSGPDQGLTYRLYNMLFRAYERSKAYDLYSSLMRLIWSGKTPGWNERDHLGPCLESCRLPASLVEQPDVLTSSAENYFASNQQALFDCGHWGVPTMSVDGEPFFGQDRLEQLRWRIEKSAL